MACRKKAFRKYFATEEHFTEFHKMAHKLLEAPTEDIARMVQAHIVDWLGSVKETHAASWFEKEWTGEHGTIRTQVPGMLEATDQRDVGPTGNTLAGIRLGPPVATST